MNALPDHRLDGPEGAPVVCLSNSLGSDMRLWDRQVGELTRSHRVLRYEHRGHGGSPAPPGPYSMAELGGEVLALLDALGIERCSFCGVSLGGAVGMWVAAEAPGRIHRLALCCTSASFGPPDGWLERAAFIRRNGTAALADATLRRWFTPAFLEREPEVAARFRVAFEAVSDEGYAGCCEALAGWDFGDRLAFIGAPTLVLAGDRDPSAPPEPEGRILVEGIPGARLVVIPDAAHLASVERADLVTPALVGHLRAETE